MSRRLRPFVLVGVGLLSAAMLNAQPPQVEETGRGSVRHSSANVKKKKTDTAKRTTARAP